MKQKTVTTTEEVKEWIENTPHHIAAVTENKNGRFMELSGRDEKIRIPSEIWSKCKIRAGGRFDTRMYRWDE